MNVNVNVCVYHHPSPCCLMTDSIAHSPSTSSFASERGSNRLSPRLDALTPHRFPSRRARHRIRPRSPIAGAIASLERALFVETQAHRPLFMIASSSRAPPRVAVVHGVNHLLDDALAKRVSDDDVERFSTLMTSIERALERCQRDKSWSASANAARATKAFATSRARVRVRDVQRAFDVIFQFILRSFSIDDVACGEWCDAALRVMEAYGASAVATRCDWKPMFDVVSKFFRGDARAYGGYGVSGSTQGKLVKVIRKSRRFFDDGAAREIWGRCSTACRSTDHNACFEAAAMLHLFTPCMKMAKESDDATFFAEAVRGEWGELFEALGENANWKGYWLSMFAQLAKHDARDVIKWDGMIRGILTTTLNNLELPIGGIEGRVPFGRKIPGRAAMIFQATRDAPAVRAAAKLLANRTMRNDERALRALEQIVDYVEHYYHPSNNGHYVASLTSFMRYLVKYAEKFLGEERRDVRVDVIRRFAVAMKRITERGMFSKNSTLRQAAMVATSRLAYMCPDLILPTVLARFEEALSHETATRQLVPAMNCLTVCVRQLLLLPLNTIFQDKNSEAYTNVNDFLASSLVAAIPGIDVNDSSKTCSALRFFCSTISNLAVLVDAGEPGANPLIPIMWSEWTVQFLSQLFALFEHLQPDTHGSKADAADANKGGAADASGFLLGPSSMYQPLLRLLFARLDPEIRRVAVSRVAAFVQENTLPELVDEVGALVQAVTMAEPETSVKEILIPLIRAIDEDVSDASFSTSSESRIRWNCGLLIMGVHRTKRSVAAELSSDIKALVRKIFKACETNGNMELLDNGGHLLSMLVAGLTSTYIIDEELDILSADGVTDWVTSKWDVDERGDVVGAQHVPTPFEWTFPGQDDIADAKSILDEFLRAPAHALMAASSEDAMDVDDSSTKDLIRVHVSAIGGVITGFRLRLGDFADTDEAFIARHAPCIPGSDARGLAASALVAAIHRTSADDSVTLRLVCFAADAVLNPTSHAFTARRAGYEALRSDMTYLTQPKLNGINARVPRWLIAEQVRLCMGWRDATAVYRAGSSEEFNASGPTGDQRRIELVHALEEISLSKYVSVRRCALPVVDAMFERYPRDAVHFVQRSIDALAHTEENEDACIAACYALRCSSTLSAALQEETVFAPLVRAVLGSAHHGTEKAQASVGSLFLHFALFFTRGLFVQRRESIRALKTRMLESLESREPLHWSYEMMTNAMTVFFLDPSDDEAFLVRATAQFMRSTFGDLKVVRFPAMCALLMLSRYECYDTHCAPVIASFMSADPAGLVSKCTRNFALAHSALDSGDLRSQVSGKADALMQAAESLYGFANEMSGSDWPMTRAFEFLPSTGAFIVAVARFWMLLTRVAPDAIVSGLRATLDDSIQHGERSVRCAVSEILAGALASRAVTNTEDVRWMERAFIKYALDASTDQREEWLRGAAYCTDSGHGNISDSLLRHLLEIGDSLSTVAQISRSIEITRVCVAQLGRGGGLDIKRALFEKLADPVRTPIFHESRIVRESGAQLAALMVASAEVELMEYRARVVDLWTWDIDNTASRALNADPASPDPALTKYRDALEGIFYACLELVRRGDGAAIASSVPLILSAALRTAESKDKDFAMVAKLTVAYLKYLRFDGDVLRTLTRTLCATLQDSNWHTRAASLRFIQALTYGHAFALEPELFMMLRAAVVASLSDKQLEVAQLASSTLMIFIKGVGAESEAELRDSFLRIAKTTPIRAEAEAGAVALKHAAILGLSASVLANPYDVPPWMPEVMETLGFSSLEPAPMKQTAQKMFAEFKKTRNDSWAQTRAAFTHDQWDAVTLGLDLAPSYIV